jgi:mono/diheme cytochrome c family protein
MKIHMLAAFALLLTSVQAGIAADTSSLGGSSNVQSVSAGAVIAQGQGYAKASCAGCHAADYKGHPGKSPNITRSGALKSYTKAQFAALLSTGKKSDGKQLSHMPVLGWPASKSDPTYAYLKTLK